MPYKSKAQSRFLHAVHPDIAARWDKEYPDQKRLPKKKGKKKSKKSLNRAKSRRMVRR